MNRRGRPPGVLYRQYAGAMLLFAMAAGLILIYLLGGFAPQFRLQLDVGQTMLGVISTTFYLVAAVFSWLSPRVVAWVGAVRSLSLLFILAAGGCIALAAASGPFMLFGAVILGGMAAALSNPATNEFLSGMCPPYAVLIGVKQSGVQVAALIAGVVVVPLAATFGWRSVVVATGIFCLVLAGIGPSTLFRFGSTATVESRKSRKSRKSWTHWSVLAYAFFMGGGLATVTTYLALFAYEELNVPAATAGVVVGIVGVGGIVARLGWSLLGERVGSERLRFFLSAQALMACLSVALLLFTESWGEHLLWLAALMIGFTAAAWNSLVYLFVILRGVDVGRLSGQIQTAFYFGLLSTPSVFGIVIERTQLYELAWAGTASLFLGAALVGMRVPRTLIQGPPA